MELRLVDISKEFVSYDRPGEGFTAVDHVSLHVGEGELVTLLGPSGCGKTTLLRMISGFEDPDTGDIMFGEKRVNDLPPNRRNSTMVFQSYAIFPHLDVFENIAFGLRIGGLAAPEIAARMERVVGLVGLSGLERRAPSQLSGGQQQRVALARAVVMEPELLLFDEPLSNLDAKLREQMRIEIRQLQRRVGITSVYVTHDQTEAMSISDRVVVMNHGRIEQVGTPLDLYAHPANRFVADFIGKVNFLPATVAGPGRVSILGREYHLPRSVVEVAPGTQVSVTIRPEAVRLRAGPGAEAGDFRGTVRRATFLGSVVEYEVEVAGLGTVIVHAGNPVLEGLREQGEEVGLELPPGALHPLPPE